MIPFCKTPISRWSGLISPSVRPPSLKSSLSRHFPNSRREFSSKPTPPLDFNDSKTAFASKSTLDLVHSIAVYNICSVQTLVKHADKIISFSRKVFGDAFVVAFLKPTLYNYFCAGENTRAIQKTTNHLGNHGIGAILDYAAESDISEVASSPVSTSRYLNSKSRELDSNMKTFISCINTTADTTENGFAAIKITALGDVILLERVTHMLNSLRYLWLPLLARVVAQRSPSSSTISTSDVISKTEFSTHIVEFFDLSPAQIDYFWTAFTARTARGTVEDFCNGKLPDTDVRSNLNSDAEVKLTFNDWYVGLSLPQSIALSNLTSSKYTLFSPPPQPFIFTPPFTQFTQSSDPLPLSDLLSASAPSPGVFTLDSDDVQASIEMYSRSRVICSLSHNRGVRTMVDAEHCYFQPAIDAVAIDMQRVFNVYPKHVKLAMDVNTTDYDVGGMFREFGCVWQTYQNYLKDCTHRLNRDLDTADKEGWFWGAKLVRGAYMVHESKQADTYGFENPVCDTINDTHRTYNSNILNIISSIPHHTVSLPSENGLSREIRLREVMAASHNVETMELVTEHINKQHLPPSNAGVYFGQLLGMCDTLTYTLGRHGFKANKYVPYGEVMEVLPYLLRRAQENSTMLGNAGRERELLCRELMRRLKTFPFSKKKE